MVLENDDPGCCSKFDPESRTMGRMDQTWLARRGVGLGRLSRDMTTENSLAGSSKLDNSIEDWSLSYVGQSSVIPNVNGAESAKDKDVVRRDDGWHKAVVAPDWDMPSLSLYAFMFVAALNSLGLFSVIFSYLSIEWCQPMIVP